jgi:hypothetical protein
VEAGLLLYDNINCAAFAGNMFEVQIIQHALGALQVDIQINFQAGYCAAIVKTSKQLEHEQL